MQYEAKLCPQQTMSVAESCPVCTCPIDHHSTGFAVRHVYALLIALGLLAVTEATAQVSVIQLRNGASSTILQSSTGGTFTLTFPSSAGTNGQTLLTDGSGNLSWGAGGGGASSISGLTDGYATTFDGVASTGGDVFIGHKPTSLDATRSNTVVGIGAVTALGPGNTAIGNTVIGFGAGAQLTNESLNTAIGGTSQNNAFGSSNTTVGWETGFELSATAEGNVALGFRSYRNSTTGDYNIAIGHDPLYAGGSGSDNIAIGRDALKGSDLNTPNTGSVNIAIGRSIAMNATSAGSNVIVGHDAAGALTTGSENTLIGYGTGSTLTTGSRNVMIGYLAGSNAAVDASDKLYIDNSNAPSPLIYGDFAMDSVKINGSMVIGQKSYYSSVELNALGSPVTAVATSGTSATAISDFTATYQTVYIEAASGVDGFVKLPQGADGQIVYLRLVFASNTGNKTVTVVNNDGSSYANTVMVYDGTGADVILAHMMYTSGEGWVLWQAIEYDKP